MDRGRVVLITSMPELSTQTNAMSLFLAELIGTMILIILGDGVVANVVLNNTKGQNSGWIVITTGWALGVAVAVYCVVSISGAHLNPAVTLGLAAIGKFSWGLVPTYILAQVTGAVIGATVVWLAYFPHSKGTDKAGSKVAGFFTRPAVRLTSGELGTEAIRPVVFGVGAHAILFPGDPGGAFGFLQVL